MSTKKSVFFGLLSFAVTMAIMLTAGYWIQMKLGLYGVAITELIFLLIVAVFMFITKIPLKEVFYFKKPQGWHVGGGIATYAGTYMLVLGSTYIMMYFFPEMAEVNAGIANLANSVTLTVAVIIMAIMPAVCEEALHRGFILTTFKGISKTWIVVLMMAVIFGVFHADPYRFLPTAILGGGLSYIALKTENLLIPMFFHFFNNVMSVASAFSLSNISDEINGISLDISLTLEMAVGYALTFFGLAIFLLYIGWKTLNRRKANTISRAKRWILKIAALLIVITGFYFIGTAALRMVEKGL